MSTSNSATLAALPPIIQGGMGIGVSDWRLARAVSLLGHLGVVSGTAIDTLFVRRLQDGDPGGHMRRGLADFPWKETARSILERYFRPEGRAPGEPYRLLPMWRQQVSPERERLAVAAAFVEVRLAKEGHDGVVGMNLLTKVQIPNPATLYGAILAGVDVVLMGAGIPKEIPGLLDDLAAHRATSLRLDVEGARSTEDVRVHFDPAAHWNAEGISGEGAGIAAEADPRLPEVTRPLFFPIIASSSLARVLLRKSNGRVDGFVVEGPTAGGHNAPPRGKLETTPQGEPVYGERDVVDLSEMADLGVPFWLAGGEGSPEGLRRALASGARGIQVGTLFSLADESGLTEELKRRVLTEVREGALEIRTDLKASPTGFPFKVVQLEGTGSSQATYDARVRICDLGYLRTPFRDEDGRIHYRCPAEPAEAWARKGGQPEALDGRRCLCNALMADVGAAQVRVNGTRVEEPGLLTSGDDLLRLSHFLRDRERYDAADVIQYLTSEDSHGPDGGISTGGIG